jgi:hypothetical protein
MRIVGAALGVLIAGLVGIGTAAAQGPPSADAAPRVRNGETPAEGTRTWDLRELWRVGGDAEGELIMGAIGDVASDASGDVYALDRQLSQVHVFSADGAYRRSLSREGEGPGDTRRPRGVVLLPDGDLGVVQMQPGKIVRLARDGTARGSILLGGEAATQGGMSILFDAACRAGRLFVCGESMSPGSGTFARTRYLSRIGEDGVEQHRYLEQSHERNLAGFKWNEAEDYFVHMGRFAVAPDGRVYAAPVRDRYEIHVFAPDGALERVIERPAELHQRSDAERKAVGATMRMVINGREIEKEISDHDPAIARLRVDAAGRLWVLPRTNVPRPPAGVMETYDVFDASGRFTHQVAVRCPGEPRRDRLFFLDDGRAVLVQGYADALEAALGGGGAGEESEEAAPLTLICYRVSEGEKP